jgi:hypothetical protein
VCWNREHTVQMRVSPWCWIVCVRLRLGSLAAISCKYWFEGGFGWHFLFLCSFMRSFREANKYLLLSWILYLVKSREQSVDMIP